MSKIQFRQYQSSDFEPVIQLLTNLLDTKDITLNKRFFEWKYLGNPFTNTILAFVAVDDSRIIAFRGYVASEFKLNDKTYPMALLSDTITLPEYRGKGIFRKLTDYSLKFLCDLNYFKGILNLSPSWTPTRGYLEMGWKGLAEQVTFYSFNPFSFFNSNSQLSNEKTILIKDFKIVISKNKLNKELFEFYQKYKDYGRLESNKNEQYLDFKYSNPTIDYIFVYLYKNDQLVNFISNSIYGNKNLKMLEIGKHNLEELKIMLNSIQKLLNPKIISYFSIDTVNENSTICFKAFTISSKHKIFKKFFGKNKPPRLIRATDYSLTEVSWLLNGECDIRLKHNWIINPVDSDSL